MPILIRHDRFDERLDGLTKRQPVASSRTALVDAILEVAIEACERTGNAEAWREIGQHSAPVPPARSEADRLSPHARQSPADCRAFIDRAAR